MKLLLKLRLPRHLGTDQRISHGCPELVNERRSSALMATRSSFPHIVTAQVVHGSIYRHVGLVVAALLPSLARQLHPGPILIDDRCRRWRGFCLCGK